MGGIQALTHAAPKQLFLSPLRLLVFSGPPPDQLVSKSWVGVSEGWDRMEQVEGGVGKQRGEW